MADEPIVFQASFPPIQSAIKIDGQGGARIQLDIPESEMGNFIRAMTWRGKRLLVTIELASENLIGLDENAKQARQGAEKRTAKVGRGRD